MHRSRYRLKQGNLLQKFQITNQVILFVFTFVCFSFKKKNLSVVRPLLMWGRVYVGYRGIYSLKQGNPLQDFNITNQMINLLFFSYGFTFYYDQKLYHG